MIKNSFRYEQTFPTEFNTLGKGLSVLICSDYQFQFNWMTFAAWYSVKKFLPEATVGITVARPSKIDTYLYNWVYKLDIKYFMHKNVGNQTRLPYLNKIYGTYVALKEGLLSQPLLVLDADMMAVSSLSEKTLDYLVNSEFSTSRCPYNLDFANKPVGPIWGFNKVNLDKIECAINGIKSLKGENHLDLLALSKIFGDGTTVIDDLGSETQEQAVTTFTHYRDRCGNFVKKDWEKGKTLPPFNVCRSIGVANMTVNEEKVISLWGKMGNLYNVINQVKN